MENLCLVNKNDLVEVMRDQVFGRFENVDVSAEAACEVLQISKPTLDRWVKHRVLEPVNNLDPERRVVRRFNLARLLSLDKKILKQEYRAVREG